MKKKLFSIFIILSVLPMSLLADDYSQLWKKVDEASKKDLPRTEIKYLGEITSKAEKDKDYGQMLKAEWQAMSVWSDISPDSLRPQLSRVERKAASYEASDPALAAVCYAALCVTCNQWPFSTDEMKELGRTYARKAMANPALLASKKAVAYEPFTVEGRDAALFGNDLLSLVGYAVGDYKAMHGYYAATSNRTATLLTALDMLRNDKDEKARGHFMASNIVDMAALDSLERLYSDLPACGEVAIEKYQQMEYKGAKPGDMAAFANDALSRWGSWPRMSRLRNALKILTCPMLSVEAGQDVIMPSTPLKFGLRVRNIGKATMSVTRLGVDGTVDDDPNDEKGYNKLKAKMVGGIALSSSKSFVGRKDYEIFDDSLFIGGLAPGVYMLEVVTDRDEIAPYRKLLYVTDMYVVNQELPGERMRFAVVCAATGQPVPGARIDIWLSDGKKLSKTCDGNGEVEVATVKSGGAERVRAYTGNDNAMPEVWAYEGYSYYPGNNDTRDIVSLYTDRKIYRPGQTVHVAAVMRNVGKQGQKAVGGREFKVMLRDANYKIVAEKNLVTDDYGTASADFALPVGTLTGGFSLRTDGNYGGLANFKVEEYKRPTFRVEFDKVNEKYENGDTVVVTGRATTYAGVPVQGATVRFDIRREQSFWWRGYGYVAYGEDRMADLGSGETVTGSDGTFKIKMPMLLPEWNDDYINITKEEYYRLARFYDVVAEADVTDQGGETRHGEISLPFGSKPTAFSCDMPDKTLRDSLKTITFMLKNAAGNDLAGDVTYTVDGVDGTFTAKANVPVEVTWNTAAALKSGRHTLTAVCGTDTIKHDFVVFAYDDVKPCMETHDWFYVSGSEFPGDGSPVYLQLGSSDSDVHVLYTVISGENVLKNGTMEMSNEVKTYKLVYKEEYGDGLLLNMVWVKNGKAYNHTVKIKKPLPDKRLVVKWTTFRDRLTPGQDEEWALSIVKPDGTPADAQLMATMYDASLDQIVPFSWSFMSYLNVNLPYTRWGVSSDNYGSIMFRMVAPLDMEMCPDLDFGSLSTGDFGKSLYDVAYASGVKMENALVDPNKSMMSTPKKGRTRIGALAMSKGVELDKSTTNLASLSVRGTAITVKDTAGDGRVTTPIGQDVQLRENLNETAFFYPALQSDGKGNISLKFTLPESVTTWRFIGLAHDKEMNNGIIEGKAVASKKVIVQPNVPRFVRVGDRASIAARIFNTSGEPVKGTAVMQLVDPETEKVVVEMKKKFEAKADSTASVSFNYYADANRSLLVCRVFAEGKDFSDGEQHYLPVLPDAELVTTTVPFTQNGPGVRTIDVKALFPDGGRNERLTVEYTNNPAWLMIQTLPYINDAQGDDAVSLSAAYYANSISAYLMNRSMKIKSVFSLWKREEGQASLNSSLDKNGELKEMVLDETPWVAEADRESDQKRMLANYFDESTLANNLSSTLEKLRKLQSPKDGSWCWWPGMPYGSPSLTASVVETLVRLDKMTGNGKDTKDMVDRALTFLGGVVVKDVEDIRKNEKEGHTYQIIWDNAVRYLYICALSDRKMTAEESAAAKYVLDKVKENNTGLNLYHKALMAVVLAKRGETRLAGEYVKSLDEYSVVTDEMGRYYDSPRAGYSWFDYRIPTQVAAIEAMRLVDPSGYAGTVDEMKRWLLQQKRVQGWNTPINSVNAVYAFLDGNTDALESKAETELAVDGKPLDLPLSTAGLGYVKTTTDGSKADTFTATKTSEGTSWGAVYAQSVRRVSDIESHSAGMSVKREVIAPEGKSLKHLSVGDRVKVRITIKADRDYDYVQLKDKRAACMEPVNQLSGYRIGYYCAPKDNATYYYFDRLSKGTHVVEAEYYIDRGGRYETGTCTVQCAYSPEYSGRCASQTIEVK